MKAPQSLSLLKSIVGRPAAIPVKFIQDRPGWLSRSLPPRFSPPKPVNADLIEARAARTQELGPRALWDGYKSVSNYPRATAGSARSSDQVRSTAAAGRLYAWLAAERAAATIGMGFMAGARLRPRAL
jgi:hypothetical protein